MLMPVEQFVLLELPLGAYMAREDENTFQLVIPTVAFFGLEVRPVVRARVTHVASPRPAVVVEAVQFALDGSEPIRAMQDLAEVRGRTTLTWEEGEGEGVGFETM